MLPRWQQHPGAGQWQSSATRATRAEAAAAAPEASLQVTASQVGMPQFAGPESWPQAAHASVTAMSQVWGCDCHEPGLAPAAGWHTVPAWGTLAAGPLKVQVAPGADLAGTSAWASRIGSCPSGPLLPVYGASLGGRQRYNPPCLEAGISG